jgi:hypothetical protein
VLTVRIPLDAPLDPVAATVGVLVDRGPAGRAGLRLAALLAARGRAPAVGAVGAVGGAGAGAVDGRAGRRVAAARAALARHGVPATELDGPVDVLLVPDGAEHAAVAPATVLVRVRPAATDLDDDLDEALARVAAPDRAGPVAGRPS